jgi:hypothetical protein
MALFDEIETPVIPERDDPIQIKHQPAEYAGITIDTRYQPNSAVGMWINGSNWTIDYYSQVLGPTVEPTTQNIERTPEYQQYRLIKKLPLKVNRALEISQTQITDTFSVTGAGHMYPFVTPNKGDMFIGNIGDGKAGLFTITERRRETFLKNSTYAIEWKMVRELDKTWQDDLDRKTMETLYFSASSMQNGCGPFVSGEGQADLESYSKIYSEMVRRYFNDFFSVEHSTFLVPDQLWKTYDHFVTKAMIQMIGSAQDGRIRRVKALNVQSESVMLQPTIWDAIVRHDPSRAYDSTERAFLAATKISRWKPELQAIGYTGIERMVFPIDAPTDVDAQYDLEDRFRPWGIPFHEGRPRRPEAKYRTQLQRDLLWFQRIAPEVADDYDAWRVPADIHPVTRDTHYVFSEAFYRCDAKLQSKLEMLTHQMINREALNLDQFKAVLVKCFDWDNLERFYFHPVLLAMLAYAQGAKINVKGI